MYSWQKLVDPEAVEAVCRATFDDPTGTTSKAPSLPSQMAKKRRERESQRRIRIKKHAEDLKGSGGN